MLGDLENETTAALNVLDLKSVENGGELLAVELDVDDGTNDGLDGTGLTLGGSLGSKATGCWRKQRQRGRVSG